MEAAVERLYTAALARLSDVQQVSSDDDDDLNVDMKVVNEEDKDP